MLPNTPKYLRFIKLGITKKIISVLVNNRITETGDKRITEDGSNRILN